MCELFGVSSAREQLWNELLKEFFSHGTEHPHGWGIALFRKNMLSLEKQPQASYQSDYLKQRLQAKIEVKKLIAHIRLATRGNMDYVNSHPFVMDDQSGRTWTFAHNGTIFEFPPLEKYFHQQEGETDSERILCYLIDNINQEERVKNRHLSSEERFRLIDSLIGKLSVENKLNLIFDDGELMYVHTNFMDSLYLCQSQDTAIFSTRPLSRGEWVPLPLNTLLAFQDGKQKYTGTNHGNEFFEDEEKMRLLFLDYSTL